MVRDTYGEGGIAYLREPRFSPLEMHEDLVAKLSTGGSGRDGPRWVMGRDTNGSLRKWPQVPPVGRDTDGGRGVLRATVGWCRALGGWSAGLLARL